MRDYMQEVIDEEKAYATLQKEKGNALLRGPVNLVKGAVGKTVEHLGVAGTLGLVTGFMLTYGPIGAAAGAVVAKNWGAIYGTGKGTIHMVTDANRYESIDSSAKYITKQRPEYSSIPNRTNWTPVGESTLRGKIQAFYSNLRDGSIYTVKASGKIAGNIAKGTTYVAKNGAGNLINIVVNSDRMKDLEEMANNHNVTPEIMYCIMEKQKEFDKAKKELKDSYVAWVRAGRPSTGSANKKLQVNAAKVRTLSVGEFII